MYKKCASVFLGILSVFKVNGALGTLQLCCLQLCLRVKSETFVWHVVN